MNHRFLYLLSGFGLLFSETTYAQTPASLQPVKFPHCFIENFGQIKGQDQLPVGNILFSLNDRNFHCFLRRNSFSYELYTPTGNPPSELNSGSKYKPAPVFNVQRIDVNFIGANSNPEITKGSSDGIKWIYDGGRIVARSYRQITLHNIYNQIDIVFFAKFY
jgi:hypothetical protein